MGTDQATAFKVTAPMVIARRVRPISSVIPHRDEHYLPRRVDLERRCRNGQRRKTLVEARNKTRLNVPLTRANHRSPHTDRKMEMRSGEPASFIDSHAHRLVEAVVAAYRQMFNLDEKLNAGTI